MATKPGKPTGDLEAVNRMHETQQNRQNTYTLNQNIPASTKYILYQSLNCDICAKASNCKYIPVPGENWKCPLSDFQVDYEKLKRFFPGYDWSEFIR